ncbi:phage tail length tape measure family protein [Novosphingobium olei]|uniref:phage tail length tape measure family protein n=1 Tax=Novosphingobium olei TaxID=2728851 RepID=UPI00308B5C81|nr:phage tail length tape measure family protein [Novosphingobium olei]
MSSLIGALRVTLGLDSAAFERGASAVEKRAAKMSREIESQGKAMTSLGQKLSLAVTTPLVAFGYASVKAAMESRDAMAQVEASIASMGNAAGRTSEQLGIMASDLMHKSLYDDDEILRKVTANLLTFGAVRGQVFDQAQKDAVDLAAKFGMDLQGATMMLGKALQDPVKGISALSRAGVSFSAEQKAMIKDMVAAGNAAGAQKLILAELEKQVAGSAEAAAKANPMAALKHSFDDFQEAVGGQLLQMMPPITAAITNLLTAFNSLSPAMQQGLVIAAGLAAVFGPLLTVLGTVVTAMAPFLGALSVAFAEGGVLLVAKAAIVGLTAAFGPWLLAIGAVAAVGAAIYANWDKVAPILKQVWAAMQQALGPATAAMLDAVNKAFSEIASSELVGALGKLGMVLLEAWGGALPGVLRALASLITGVVQVISDAVRIIVDLLSGDFGGAMNATKDLATHFVNAIGNIFGGMAQAVIGFVSGMVRGIDEWVGGKLTAIWNGVLNKIDAVKRGFFGLYDAVVGHSYIPDMVDGIAAQMLRLDSVMVDKAKKTTESTKEAFKALAGDVQQLLDRLFPEAAALNQYRSDAATIDKGQKAGMLSPAQANEARNRLATEGRGGNMDAAQAIMAGPIDVEAVKLGDVMDRMKTKAEVTTVAIAKNFKEMAQDTIGAIQNLASAIKGGGFLDILSGVLSLGLQLGSIGAFGKKIQTDINAKVPGYADGTNFHPGGLAMVGERGPELVNLPRGSKVYPHGTGPGSGSQRIQIVPSQYFDVVVDGRVMRAAPAIAGAGGEMGYRKVVRSQSRRIGW